jgi:hypothetical protein
MIAIVGTKAVRGYKCPIICRKKKGMARTKLQAAKKQPNLLHGKKSMLIQF